MLVVAALGPVVNLVSLAVLRRGASLNLRGAYLESSPTRSARWPITSGLPVLSAHVVITDEALAAGRGGRVLD